ncbi:hypothetical protein O988_04815 [Pseudogymnoascus sp. VKM F-3808]|nr:hypothetical protein O988_04815 [Pseudogymnoascus sp. VKM F-3808]
MGIPPLSTPQASVDGSQVSRSSSPERLNSGERSEHTFRAWLAVAGAFLVFFCSLGFVNAFGVFQEYYRSHQLSNHSDFDISWIGSFSTFMIFGGAPIAGVLVDIFGPTACELPPTRRWPTLTSLSFSLSEFYQVFLAQAFLLGISVSFLYCPAMATVSRYFDKNKGLTVGITVGGSSMGGVIWPIVLNELLNTHDVSFGWSIRAVGFIMIPLLIIAIVTVVSPLQTKHHSEQTLAQEIEVKRPKQDLSIAKDPTFIILCAGLAISVLGMYSPMFYITTYARSLGHPIDISFYLVSILNGSSLFGRILPGLLADRYGHFNLCALAGLASGITSLCWTAAKSIPGLVVWCLVYGFTSGAILSLQASCAGSLATRETQGTALGFLMGALALTSLFGTPISGVLVGSYGYLSLSLFAGASLVVGSILIFWARLRLNKNIFAKQ